MADRRTGIQREVDRIADDQLVTDAGRGGVARVIADRRIPLELRLPIGEAPGIEFVARLIAGGVALARGHAVGEPVIDAGGQLVRPLDADEIDRRTEEHTAELQSLSSISYSVFGWKKKTQHYNSQQAE